MKFNYLAVVIPVKWLPQNSEQARTQAWAAVSQLPLPNLGTLYGRFYPAATPWGQTLAYPFSVVLGREDPVAFLNLFYQARKKQEEAVSFHSVEMLSNINFDQTERIGDMSLWSLTHPCLICCSTSREKIHAWKRNWLPRKMKQEKFFTIWNPELRADVVYQNIEYLNFPIPRLVFGIRMLDSSKVAECSLSVVADKKPTPEAPMFYYPFSNVHPNNMVCTGNNVLPRYKKQALLCNFPRFLLELPDNWHNDYKPWHRSGQKEAQICGISVYFPEKGFITK